MKGLPRSIADEQVVGMDDVQMLSFTATEKPSSFSVLSVCTDVRGGSDM
jgi:hypothetical protein